MSSKLQPYAENGVFISKFSINAGDKVTLSYKGLLAESGADSIYAHIGYGELWEDRAYLPMKNEDGIFSVTFKTIHSGVLCVSFKDSADHWDNNSGWNYSFNVDQKPRLERTVEKKRTTRKKVDVLPEIPMIQKEKGTAAKAASKSRKAVSKDTGGETAAKIPVKERSKMKDAEV